MILIKKLLFLFLFFIKCSHGGKGCTISDILLEQYEKGNYGFYVGQRLQIANSSITTPPKYYIVTELAYYGKCLGFSTETLNTIILDCPDQTAEKSGCFQVLRPQFDTKSNTVSFTGKEEKICVSKLDESCIGLKINDELTLIFDCHFYRKDSKPYSFSAAIPLNAMPPRM